MAKAKFNGMGGMGGMNMQNMIRQAQKMQADMMKAQEELAKMETEGTAGGGAVKAVVIGTKELKSLEIKPEVVDPDDIEMLQDLVMAAVNEAFRAATAKSEDALKSATGGMGGGMPGLF
ncbi:MAG: YbaB/EbfC family nucleoid-associated protein [Butyricicoccus sp.]|nr:YbaB/EbfC family nucleoid-associated protein [Butyricicoccus sp.]